MLNDLIGYVTQNVVAYNKKGKVEIQTEIMKHGALYTTVWHFSPDGIGTEMPSLADALAELE